jgi:tetratricopeptide (TPR) repeat protein
MQRGHSGAASRLLLLGFLTLSLAVAVSAVQQRHRTLIAGEEVEIQGTVRLEEGRNHVADAGVRLEDSDGRLVDEQLVSENGQFRFAGLPKVQYTLTATAAGYETYVQRLDLTNEGGTTTVDITLRPLKKQEMIGGNDSARTDATAPKKARREVQRGTRASEEGKLSEARAHFENAVRIYSCYARAEVALALTLMRQHDSLHAEAPLKKALACDPDFIEPYLHLGRLLNAQQRYTESRGVLAEGVRRAPSSWQLYYQLGQADEGIKNYGLAEQELLRALSLAPGDSATVHEKLADVYLMENAYDKAYTEMRAYLQADPNGPYAAKIKTLMQRLESAGRVHPSQSQLAAGPPHR